MLVNDYIEKNIDKIPHDYLYNIHRVSMEYKAYFIACAIEKNCEF